MKPRSRTCRFGLNYVPSDGWYYSWNDWKPACIARDFDAIAVLGVDHLRVMTIWPWFQPNPAVVSPVHLERLFELMRLAEDRALDVFLCPLTGWLSGFSFLPPDVQPLDIFTSSKTFDRSIVYLNSVLQTVGAFPNFLGIDLGNEINVLAPSLSQAQGDTWGGKITQWLKSQMKGKWIVNGVDHNPWFTGQAFSVRHLIETYDAVTIHAWPLFTGCLIDNTLDGKYSAHLSAFLTRFCREELLRANLNKPVWIQEFGASSLWGSETQRQHYLRKSVENAVREGATWFTWWCSHDIDQRFTFDPLEYDLGLLTVDNTPKPLANLYSSLIREFSTYAEKPSQIGEIDAGCLPALMGDSLHVEGIELNRHTTTWKRFEDYIASSSFESHHAST